VSTTENRRPLAEAIRIAEEARSALAPHCDQIDICGSIRRRRPTVGDVEIVCVPLPYQHEPLFADGIAPVVAQWPKVRGELPCRYTQRILPSGMKLDLFMVDPDGYGLQFAIRTGSARWSHEVLARQWVRAGYRSEGGLLRDRWGRVVPCRTERELFDLIGLDWVEPAEREVQP
jgi:DNA polymerase/3'-5' exonuclease PolX